MQLHLAQVGYVLTKTIVFDGLGFPLSIGTDSPLISIPAGFRTKRWRIFCDADSGVFAVNMYSTTIGTWPASTLLATVNMPTVSGTYTGTYVFGGSDYINFAAETLIFLRISTITGPFTRVQIVFDFEAF
jgi:hypothetical protein